MSVIDLTDEQAEDIEERLSEYDDRHIPDKMDGCIRI